MAAFDRWSRRAGLAALLALGSDASSSAGVPGDPLPAWNDGPTKTAIVDFVTRVTTPGNADFVPQPERVAVFDNDGTLWPEKPLPQAVSVVAKLRALAEHDPSLRRTQPYKAALEGDSEYFAKNGGSAALEVVARTFAGETDETYAKEMRDFLATARHPRFGLRYTQLAYEPMVELLRYLRKRGFSTYIATGGEADFVRTFSKEVYGVPPEHVIGSRVEKELDTDHGADLVRKPEVAWVNDEGNKPLGIDAQIGKRPVIAVGNVRSGGDVAMLTYAKGREGPSLALLVNHDDPLREFAYEEPDNASLDAATERGFQVVGIRGDWATVFTIPKAAP